jgi:hypothetical protein
MICWSCAAPRREADHLEERRELDRDVERRAPGDEARTLHEEEREGPDRRDVPQNRLVLRRLRECEGEREADEDDGVRPRAHRGGVHDREDAERRERVGHDAVDEAEPHSAASSFSLGFGGGSDRRGSEEAATASTRAR